MSVTEQDIKQGRINDQLEDQLESLSAQVEAQVERGRNVWAEWRETGLNATRQWRDAANTMAKEKPWQLVGAAAAIGIVFGLLCRRR